MFTIRAATARDAAAIAHVHVQSWRTTYAGIVPDDYLAALNEVERAVVWREWLATDVSVFVADIEGEIVGFIGGGAIREPLQNCDAELFAIYILRHAQRRGIGSALLKVLAGALKDGGFRSMAVWVLESNASGRFYEKTGALPLSSKQIEIGGAELPLVAFRWFDLSVLTPAACSS